MAIMFNKGKNYSLLEKTFSVPIQTLGELLKLEASLLLGSNSLSLSNAYHTQDVVIPSLNTVIIQPSEEAITLVNKLVTNFISIANMKAISNYPPEALQISTQKNSYSSADIKLINAIPICDLKNATKMYQKVHGTSSGSVYRVVALNDTVKLAIRVVDSSVSLRVDGNLTPVQIEYFTKNGFTKKTDGYFSMHCMCDSCTPAQLLGSVICASNIAFDTPIPNLNLLSGKK